MIDCIKLWKKNHELLFKILCLTLVFCFFFAIAFVAFSKTRISEIYDFVFYSDNSRVFGDWTNFHANHYRTSVHPLYVILIFPLLVILRSFCGGDTLIAMTLFNALMSTINVYLLYKTLTKLNNNANNWISILFVLFYICSFAVIENLIIVDSYIIGTTTLLLFWCFFAYNKDKKFNYIQYLSLIVLGILCVSITITNFFQYLIGLAFLFIFKKQKNVKEFFINLLKMCLVIICSLIITYILILIQKLIFKSAENSFKYLFNNVKALFYGNGSYGELNYSSKSLGFDNFKNVIIAFLGFSFVGGSLNNGIDIDQHKSIIMEPSALTIIFIVFNILMLSFSIFMCIKKKKTILLPFICTYLFQAVFHLFYGNGELILYALHSSLLFVICAYLGLSELKGKVSKVFKTSFFAVILVELIYNLVTILIVIKRTIQKFSARNGLWTTGILILIINILILIVVLSIIYKNYFSPKSKAKKPVILKDNLIRHVVANILLMVMVTINSPLVLFSASNKAEAKVLMGMGLREKFVVEQTSKGYKFYQYDVTSKKKTYLLEDVKLKSYEFDDQNYKVTFKTKKNENIYVYENEDGIYIERNGKVQTLDDSQKINIPTFDGYSQQRLLKTLFYEVLVNVTKTGTTPNYLTYGNTWYRDGAMMAMVLKETGNLSQIEKYFNSLTADQIYDKAREGEKYKEPDNLGELLYILSLFENKNQKVIDAIISEALKIEQATGGEHHLNGITDFGDHDYYETAWLMFGLDSLGLDTSYWDLSRCDNTGRWDVFWFYKTEPLGGKPTNLSAIEADLFDITKTYYPYLIIAKLHYWEYKIDIPQDLKYPISFEFQDWGLRQQAKCSPHSWTASELFLYLLDYDNFEL